MTEKPRNLTETEEYEQFRDAVQKRIDAGELSPAHADRFFESLAEHAKATRFHPKK